MNRLFALCLMALLACSMQAQQRWWVGGAISASTESDKLNEVKFGTDQLSLSPIVGLELNDRWTVAAALEYTRTEIDNAISTSTKQTIGVGPIVRYTVAEKNGLRFYAEANGGWSTSIIDDSDHDYNKIGFGLCPGLSYTIGNRVALFSKFGGLNWQKEWYSDSGSHTSFSLSLLTSFSLGFYVYL